MLNRDIMKHILSIFILLICVTNQIYAQKKVNHYATSILCSVDSLLNIDGIPIPYVDKRKYAEIDELNGWAYREKYCERAYLRTRKDFVENFISDAQLRLLGFIDINENSKCALLSCKIYNELVIYIVNNQANGVIILTDICKATKNYWDENYSPTTFVSCLSNGIFMKCAFDVSDDLLYKGKPICSAEILEVFCFDNNGVVKQFHNSLWIEDDIME